LEKKRLPPGQRIAEDFPVLHLGEVPSFDPETWDFFLDGEVKSPLKIGWEVLNKLPRVKQISDFHCVTGWSRLRDEWEGIQVRLLLEMAQPASEAGHALVYAEGDYTTSLALKDLMDNDVLLALQFKARPLEPIHGGPARLLVPKKYAYKCAKWVRGIRLYKEPHRGFWEIRGYSDSADPWKEERHSR